jgi:hypothetical protein
LNAAESDATREHSTIGTLAIGATVRIMRLPDESMIASAELALARIRAAPDG